MKLGIMISHKRFKPRKVVFDGIRELNSILPMFFLNGKKWGDLTMNGVTY
jgi:hypothetical protein